MKAIDYFNRYIIEQNIKGEELALTSIVVDMFVEVKDIADARKTKSNSGVSAIFKEQDQKWRAFVRECVKNGYQGISPDGFAKFTISKLPEMKSAFKIKEAS